MDLDLGEKTQLLAIATLDTGGELDVTAKASFNSSNEAILRVSASGLLEAVGAGTCDLLSIVDGIRASVKVNVRGRGDDGSSDQITRLEIRGKVALDLGERRSCRPSRCSILAPEVGSFAGQPGITVVSGCILSRRVP